MSGVTALGHQLIWTRRMSDLLGVGADASVRVFGAFFLGLAIGSWIGGRVSRRTKRPWAWIAGAEVVVVIAVVPMLFLPDLAGWVWSWVGEEQVTGAMGGWVSTLGSLLLVLPPSVAMGFFLPLALHAVLARSGQIGRAGMVAYGCNTLGGVGGLALVLLILLPRLGMDGALAILMGLNVVTAIGALVLSREFSPAAATATNPEPATAQPVEGVLFLVAGLSGFCVLGAEVAGFHLLQLAMPISNHAAGILLASVITALGLGALLYPFFEERIGGLARAVPTSLWMAAIGCLATPLLFHAVVVIGRVDLFGAGSPIGFSLSAYMLGIIVLGPGFLFAGLVFPATCSALGGRAADAGPGLGRLIAVNGLAAFAGAEIAQHLALPRLGLHGTLAALGILQAVALILILRGQAGRWMPRLALGLLGISVLAFPSLRRLPEINPRLPFTVLEQTAGREGAIAVIEGAGVGRGILMQNQYLLGSSGNEVEQRRLGALPLLLHPEPRRVAFLGLATGITASAALRSQVVEQGVAVELSPAVIRLADRWFSEANAGVVRSDKMRVVAGDARIHAAAWRDGFDVIVGDLFLPWGPGESRLYTRDHFLSVRRALRPGGLFCQWLPLHQLTEDQLGIVLATFGAVFPGFVVFERGGSDATPLIGLVGWKDAGNRLDWEVVNQRVAGEADGFLDPRLGTLVAVQDLLLGAPDPAFLADFRPDTLRSLRLEILAARTQMTPAGRSGYLSGNRWVEARDRIFADKR